LLRSNILHEWNVLRHLTFILNRGEHSSLVTIVPFPFSKSSSYKHTYTGGQSLYHLSVIKQQCVIEWSMLSSFLRFGCGNIGLPFLETK
jgi:hypothetical protein